MNRMRKLRIMTSHLYFYKKLDEYGKGHDKRILEILKNEEQRHGMKVKENEGISGENVAVNETKTITNSSVSVGSTQTNEELVRKMFDSVKSVTADFQVDTVENLHSQPKLLIFGQDKENLSEEIPREALTETEKNIPEVENVNHVSKSSKVTLPVNSVKSYKLRSTTDINVLPDAGRKLTLDNVDIHQETHDMTEDYQKPDAHYCTLMSTENRVSGDRLPDDKPQCDLMDMENGKCCPNKREHIRQHENYICLVSRTIARKIPCLSFMENVVTDHIPHQYSKEMKQQTDIVGIPLELMQHNHPSECMATSNTTCLNHI